MNAVPNEKYKRAILHAGKRLFPFGNILGLLTRGEVKYSRTVIFRLTIEVKSNIVPER